MLFWILAAVPVLCLSYVGYWIAFYNPVHRHWETLVIRHRQDPGCLEELCRSMANRPFEPIQITARDGTVLAGKWYDAGNGPVYILFHGYRGSGVRDFCAIHSICMDLGISTLVVDQRAHGMSGGNTMTFGIKERYDCVDWAKYVAQRFGSDRKVYLCGVSMGAATVLMASALSMPENVAGIVADCPYSAPGAIIRKVISDVRFPAWLIYPFVVLGGLLFGGFRVWESSAIDAVSKTRIPILLIHGSEDRYVPPEMSAEIFEYCAGQRYLEVFPGAGHGGCSATDPVRYANILRAFMNNCK